MDPKISMHLEIKHCTRRLLTTAYFGGMSVNYHSPTRQQLRTLQNTNWTQFNYAERITNLDFENQLTAYYEEKILV